MSNYRFYYTTASGNGIYQISASTPLSAINQFHLWMQVRQPRTHRLGPKDYKVSKMVQYYHEAHFHANPAGQPIIESALDYPDSPNPDLTKQTAVLDTPEFNFK